jgi:hypothetical protein
MHRVPPQKRKCGAPVNLVSKVDGTSTRFPHAPCNQMVGAMVYTSEGATLKTASGSDLCLDYGRRYLCMALCVNKKLASDNFFAKLRLKKIS